MGIINVGISKTRRLLMLLLLLFTAGCFFLRAQDATKPVAPKAVFTPEALNVTVGQLTFTRPTLSVTAPTQINPMPNGGTIQRMYNY